MDTQQHALQQILFRRLQELQAKNPQYSIRAFAKKLGLQPSATNEIIKGRRRVSRKMAEKISDKLLLNPSERHDVLKHFERVIPRQVTALGNKSTEPGVLIQLQTDQFKTISDWSHFAILSLVQTPNFKSNPEWMATRLGISVKEVNFAIERLLNIGLLCEEKGTLKRTAGRVNTSDDLFDLSIQRSHLNDLELAGQKLREVPVELRDFSSFSFPANPKKIARAKEILRQAQDDLEALMHDEEANEVYRVCTYLFPLTQTSHEKKPTTQKLKTKGKSK